MRSPCRHIWQSSLTTSPVTNSVSFEALPSSVLATLEELTYIQVVVHFQDFPAFHVDSNRILEGHVLSWVSHFFLTQLCCSNYSLRLQRLCLSHLDGERLSHDKVGETLRRGRWRLSSASRSKIEALCYSASQASGENTENFGKEKGENEWICSTSR